MTSTGIRELKDNLNRTAGNPGRFDELVASGVIRPPAEAGDPTEGWPDIRLPDGTAAGLIDTDRGEA
jgi:hypothetical protein